MVTTKPSTNSLWLSLSIIKSEFEMTLASAVILVHWIDQQSHCGFLFSCCVEMQQNKWCLKRNHCCLENLRTDDLSISSETWHFFACCIQWSTIMTWWQHFSLFTHVCTSHKLAWKFCNFHTASWFKLIILIWFLHWNIGWDFSQNKCVC